MVKTLQSASISMKGAPSYPACKQIVSVNARSALFETAACGKVGAKGMLLCSWVIHRMTLKLLDKEQ